MQSRRVSLCALVLFAVASMVSSAASPDLDAVLARAMHGTRTPGIAVLVIRDGRIAGSAVRGVRRNDRAGRVKPGDTWLIGSTGKPMTIAMVARLVERGTLSWDAPLASMLPDLAASMRPEYRAVTLRQLLSHRAGLPENIVDLALLDPYFTDARPLPVQRMAYVAQALQDAPIAAPGTTFAYSNTGFLIAAAIAERATNTPFELLMQREVFVPLGMRSAGFGPTGKGEPLGHRGGKPVLVRRKADDGVPLMFAPGGNLHLSIHDWALFCVDQLAGSKGNGKLLKADSYRLMQTAQPDSHVGLDWGIQDSVAGRRGPVLVHGGSDGNWLAWVALFPATGNGVLTVANAADDMGGDKATHAVMAALLPTLSAAVAPPAASSSQ